MTCFINSAKFYEAQAVPNKPKILYVLGYDVMTFVDVLYDAKALVFFSIYLFSCTLICRCLLYDIYREHKNCYRFDI